MNILLILSVFAILIILFEIYLRRMQKKITEQHEIIIDAEKALQLAKSLIKAYENEIRKKDLEIKNIKGVAKFLSAQNIILNERANEIEKRYSENSDIIIKEKLRVANEKFLTLLQTSK